MIIQRLTPRKPAPPASSPYDLIQLTVNDQPILGRPIAWNSEIMDHVNLLGPTGLPVVATRVATICPDCNAGLELDVPPTTVYCDHCRPKVQPVEQPDLFRNPFEGGLVDFEELNLDLVTLLGDLPTDTVSDRLQ